MNRERSKRKSALAKLKQIDRLFLKLERRESRLDNAPHIPRTEPLPKGQVRTILNECDESCPTCALHRKYIKRRSRLVKLQRAALMENARSRLESDKALTKSRQKITMTKYLDATKNVTLRKQLANELKVTEQGLRKWEKKNNITWDKNNGVSCTS